MTIESAIKSWSRQPHSRIGWNCIGSITDYLFVDCEDFREALSARLDNEEDVGDARQPIDTHLAYCGDCAFWYDTAALISRRARTTAAVVWPDVSEAVLTRLPASGNRVRPLVRLALGAVGAFQCADGLVTLTTPHGDETGAWHIALGVTLGVVAVRRTPAAALIPLLGTLVAILAWGQIAGVTFSGITSLILATAGLGLVLLLGRMQPEPPRPLPPEAVANLVTGATRARGKPTDKGGDTRHPTIWLAESAKSA